MLGADDVFVGIIASTLLISVAVFAMRERPDRER